MQRALIIFAKLPIPGKVKTRLGVSIGMHEAANVYVQFAEHTFGLAEKLQEEGVSIYVFFAPDTDEDKIKAWVERDFHYVAQAGDTLGARMQHAFDLVFAEGAEASVIIGTDVPELDANTMRGAFDTLRNVDIVVGPSADGGYYLLGMKPPTKQVFGNIEWSTNVVLNQTLHRIAEQSLTHRLLSPLPDIDTIEDYDAFKKRAKFKS